MLLDKAINECHVTHLSVLKKNNKAITLYTKHGFHQVNESGGRIIMSNLPEKEEEVFEESCKDVSSARKFVSEVGRIAKKYDANYFIVTDGASGIHNDGSNDAVSHARKSHVEWEQSHGFDPDEDWSNEQLESNQISMEEEVSMSDSIHEYVYCESDEFGVDHLCISEDGEYSFSGSNGALNSLRKDQIEFLVQLNRTLNDFNYGVPDKKREKLIEPDDETFYQLYRYMSPREFLKYKGGVCWDYVSYQSDVLTRKGIKFSNIYIELLTDWRPTHTFTIAEFGYNYLYIESSYKRIANIYIANEFMAIFNFVLFHMITDHNNELLSQHMRAKPKCPFLITTYKSYTNYGCDAMTFMNDMHRMDKLERGVFKIRRKIIPDLQKLSEIIGDVGYEYFFEAASVESTYLRDCVEERIFTTLAIPTKDRMYKRIINDFIERNMLKLVTSGPVHLIVFGDNDQNKYFDLFGISREEITKTMIELTKTIDANSDFKYLRGNPIFVILYYCIRYYTLHEDKKGVNMTLSIYVLAVYWSIYTKYFPNGVIEPVMQYTIDNLTDKFLLKKSKHIFAALIESASRSYEFHKPRILNGTDGDCISWIQRIRNDQNSLIKKIANEYMKNWRAGNAISVRNDDYDENTPNLDTNENATSLIQQHVSKVTLPIISNGVDIMLAEAAAKMAQISVSDCRFYLIKIMDQKNLEVLERFIESILFLFIYEEKHTIRDIRSRYFLSWAASLFKKTNSKNKNIERINEILETWGEESGIYERFKREASRINYKKAIFFYTIMSIQKYS